MKLNREQLAAVLAALIVIAGAREIVLGVLAPTGRVLPADPEISRGRREVVPRRFRGFTADGDVTRNPFVFSEGWQTLDVLPMDVPPLPPAPRPVPRPLLGAPQLDARVLFAEGRAVEAAPAARGEPGTAGTVREGG